MNAEARRSELGAFLRSRRELLRPEDIRLEPGERRRVSGLKREEVAAASSVSTAWYTWLEQGRKIRASAKVFCRIAQTLRLSEQEWIYLSLLAGLGMGAAVAAPEAATTSIVSIQKTLDAFTNTPAALYNQRFDVLRANAAALAVYGPDMAGRAKWQGNMIWRYFMDEDRRQMYPDAQSDLGIRNLIEVLRINWANSDGNSDVEEIVDELRHVSAEFDGIWIERRVATLATVPGRVQLRGSGQLVRIKYSRFVVPDLPGHAIAALVPTDSASARVLEGHLNHAG